MQTEEAKRLCDCIDAYNRSYRAALLAGDATRMRGEIENMTVALGQLDELTEAIAKGDA